MKSVKLIAAMTAIAAATPALAGSIDPAPADPVIVTPVAPVAPAAGWTGGYAGGSLGWNGMESDGGFDDDGLTYGAHAGYDYDFGSYTLGGEVQYSASEIFDNGAADALRLKARAGYDLGDTLVYGLAGGSMINDSWGYNVGAGVEHMMTDTVSVGAEYIYDNISDFADTGNTLTGNSVAARVNYRF